jgi:hypothetical protein
MSSAPTLPPTLSVSLQVTAVGDDWLLRCRERRRGNYVIV